MNKQVILSKRPIGFPAKETWEWKDGPIPQAKDGEIVVQVHYVSLDPAMRGWMNDARSYVPPIQLGEVMRSGGVGKVIESKHTEYRAGDFVCGMTGVQQYCTTDARGFVKVDPALHPLPKYLGILGMPGFTAYFGLLEVGKPVAGNTVLISAAAGAVGSVVGQIAKIKGCRAVGIAGGPEKCRHVVEELGFDACVDYKSEGIKKEIRKQCPDGIDVYFDNVGGEILDAVLTQINFGARIVICGAISQYNNPMGVQGPKNYLSLLVNSARMEGFVVFNYYKRYREAAAQLGQWLTEGKLRSREQVDKGIDNFYESFGKLFTGEKRGKMVLQVIDD